MASKILLCAFAQVVLIQSISAYCGGSAYNAALNAPFAADAYATERYAANRIASDRYGAERLAADAYATERYAADRVAADRFAADAYATERYAAAPFAAPLASPMASSLGSRFASPLAASYGEIPLSYAATASASHGGPLPVASSSPIPPNGVSVFSENAIEGALAVSGQLPFLGTVALEGALPTAGSGAVNFGAGNGNVAILNEEASGYGYEPMAYGFGRGLGCGARY
ncbi:chorion class CB protein PC404-like [Pieris napi]|uniref:chorion class CB protein PC404-like n=1 Tax=Pieris napi TaxID=78633 RepID=UPI001FBBA477|nr:chorion class CB protein PC404-like [Pieris napi]